MHVVCYIYYRVCSAFIFIMSTRRLSSLFILWSGVRIFTSYGVLSVTYHRVYRIVGWFEVWALDFGPCLVLPCFGGWLRYGPSFWDDSGPMVCIVEFMSALVFKADALWISGSGAVSSGA